MAGKVKAGTKMERYDTLRTPKGIAGFSFLREPDEKFGAKHRIQLFIDPNDPEVKEFINKILARKAEYCKKIGKKDDKKVPGLKKADAYMAERFGSYGIKEGSLYFEFTSNARKVEGTNDWEFIKVFDVRNQENPELRVFSGDVVRAAVTLMGYNTGREYGIKAYLNAVQVLVKKNLGGRTNPFVDESAEYGTEEAEEPSEPASPFDVEDNAEEAEVPAESKAASAKSKKGGKKAEPAEGESDDEGGIDLQDLI